MSAIPPGQGAPPPQGYAQPPQGYAQPPQGYAQPPQGYAQPPQGYQQGQVPPAPPGAPQTKTVEWMPPPQAVANCPPGLEYLTQIDQILVHQQVELWELMTGWETANRYVIKNTLGQQIYFAAENSNCCARQYCGPNRPFEMSIMDNTQHEVIHIVRPYRCSAWCCFCCLQKMEVQSPPGQIVGYVRQDCTFWNPKFTVLDAEEREILNITGNCIALCCRWCSDIDFDVTAVDGTSVGKVSKQWSGLAREYFTDADNFGIKFPMDLDVRVKAVVMGACFLIDFMFFEQQNRQR
ncbi:Phospholipid scramblase 2-like [Oopsacas minuta]|uniref:Phospholipid scramblase n=1 Tax=Oopsacas minuta TaxID=111878 RepID=A0AAV7JLD6_9METZ|nr:Phospholipid scramblase 2-like [Oopsacas minuta]